MQFIHDDLGSRWESFKHSFQKKWSDVIERDSDSYLDYQDEFADIFEKRKIKEWSPLYHSNSDATSNPKTRDF